MCNCGCRFAYEYTAAYTIWCNLLLCCLKLCHAILLFGFAEGICWTFPSINLLENLQCGLGTLLGSHPYCRAWFHPTPLFLHLGRLHLGCHCYPHVHHRCAFERGIWGSQPPGGSPKDVGNGHHPPEPSLAVLPPCCRGLVGVLHSPFLHRSGWLRPCWLRPCQLTGDRTGSWRCSFRRSGWKGWFQMNVCYFGSFKKHQKTGDYDFNCFKLYFLFWEKWLKLIPDDWNVGMCRYMLILLSFIFP